MNKSLFALINDNRNSLLHWFPKTKDLDIPVPKTGWVEIPRLLLLKLLEASNDAESKIKPYFKKVKSIAKKIGYPVFIRTDLASGKFGWNGTSFVMHEGKIEDHIMRVVEFNETVGVVGLNYRAIVVRAFLELDWRFKAFHGGMPVARERRYFVKDGVVLCHHPYWIKEAFNQAHGQEGSKSEFFGYIPHKLPNTWEQMLKELNFEPPQEIELLSGYARRISQVLKGYWSVDFACSRDGKWYLIDMALGQVSTHPACSKKSECQK